MDSLNKNFKNHPGTLDITLKIILNITLKILPVIIFFVVSAINTQANYKFQDDIFNTPVDTSGKDTVCFRFDYRAGDTLIYVVISYDSIVVDYEDPLKKTRLERIRIVCDSVGINGNFFFSIEMIELLSSETTKKDETEITRTESEWLNRKSFIEIDSVGNRISTRNDDMNRPAMAPGGAFTSYLFFSLKDTCKEVGESWIVSSLEDLVENGIPTPALRQTSLFRVYAPFDTLGKFCNKLEYIKTAQGSVGFTIGPDTLRITTVISGFGIIALSVQDKVPVHYYFTSEQKVTFHLPDHSTKPGWHYTNSNWTLDYFVRGPEKPIKPVNGRKNKNKK